MKAKKVLFVTQEITPYVPESEMAKVGRYLPQAILENGREIRTFMPKWGIVNERRNQLHEVIRLSGMNIIIDDTDHPLIIKVASIQPARIQVYFIDNDDYFQHRLMAVDKDGVDYEDNEERAIFYARGVLETMKKLRWAPDIIHCQGWMSAFVPLYVKKVYGEEPVFRNCKIVYSFFNDVLQTPLTPNALDKVVMRGVTKKELQSVVKTPENFMDLYKFAVSYSDGIIQNSTAVDEKILSYAKEIGKPILDYQPEDKFVEAFESFCEQIMGEEAQE